MAEQQPLERASMANPPEANHVSLDAPDSSRASRELTDAAARLAREEAQAQVEPTRQRALRAAARSDSEQAVSALPYKGGPGYLMKFSGMKFSEKVMHLLFKQPLYALSAISAGIENFGADLVQKHASWVRWFPGGTWLVSKAEKTMKERETEERKRS